MLLVGGLVATLLRIVQEKLMPAGAIAQQLSLQGLGDASFALGDFIKNYAVLPSYSTADAQGNMVNDWQPFANAITPYLPNRNRRECPAMTQLPGKQLLTDTNHGLARKCRPPALPVAASQIL